MIRSILIHVLTSVLVAGVLSWMAGHLTPWIAGISLFLGFVVGAYLYLKIPKENEPRVTLDSFFTGTVYFIVFLICMRHMTYLFFESGSQIKTLDTNNFGDLTMHIGILKNLASGDKFWPEFVSLAGTPLQYPFGVDFYNALWEAVGVPTQSHLFFVGIVLLLCLMFVAYWWLGVIGIVALFFNGGWQGYAYMWTGVLQDYQNDWGWKNFFLTLLIPQRGFLIGLPLGIYILKKSMDFIFFGKTLAKTEKYILWFMWGMLPIFHVHTFIAVTLLIAIFVFVQNPKSPLKLNKETAVCAGLAGLLALAWLLPLTGFLQKASIIHFQMGWSLNGKSIWQNLYWGYGPWLMLLLVTIFFVSKKRLSTDKKILFSALFLFILFQFVIMAPWDWDNIKLLIWPYLAMVFVFGRIISEYFHEQLKVPTYIALGFSGFVCVIALSNAHNKGHGIYETRELNAATAALAQVPVTAVFAAHPTFNHALTYFGKKVAYAYDGHIWSHGLKDGQRKEKVEKILNGDSNWRDLAKEIGVTHIYWGPREQKEYPNNQPWKSLQKISVTSEVEVYVVE